VEIPGSKEAVDMSRHATATFKVKSWDEKPYDELDEGPKLTRASVTKTFEGERGHDVYRGDVTSHVLTSSILSCVFAVASLAPVSLAQAETGVVLALSSPGYQVGEDVRFTVTNKSEQTIWLPSLTSWRIRDSEGLVMAPCFELPLMVELPPGRSWSSAWNQEDCGEEQVPQGRYFLEVVYRWDETWGDDQYIEASFDIGMVPIYASTWGQVKASFR
jgi:hypothetical protein